MKETVRIDIQGRPCYVASADAKGIPHLSVGEIETAEENRIDISGWYCPQTLSNLASNSSVSITVGVGENGYQFIGKVKDIAVDAIMNGFVAGEEKLRIPQVRYRLSVDIEKIMDMTERAHSDKDIS